MDHEISYYSKEQNKAEEGHCLKILNEGLDQLKKAGIDAHGQLLNGNAVDKIA